MRNELDKSIFETLAYFDIFGIPLTIDEIELFLRKNNARREDILKSAQTLIGRNLIELEGNFYFLRGRRKIIEEHLSRKQISERLIAKTIKFAPILKTAPFVRAILVTGSASMNNASEKSDIDLILVVDKDYIYTAKTYLWILLRILNQYQTKSKKAGKFSVGYCYSTKYLTLLENAFMYPSPMAAYWLAVNLPVFDAGGYAKLLNQNKWLANELPNFSPEKKLETLKTPRPDTIESKLQKVLEKLLDNIIGRGIEAALAKIHIEHTWHLPENYLSSSCTIAIRERLQLNAKEASKKIKEAFEERMRLYTQSDAKSN